MTAEEYYHDVSDRLHKARIDLGRAYDEERTEEAAHLVSLIQVLIPEEKDAYQKYIKS